MQYFIRIVGYLITIQVMHTKKVFQWELQNFVQNVTRIRTCLNISPTLKCDAKLKLEAHKSIFKYCRNITPWRISCLVLHCF